MTRGEARIEVDSHVRALGRKHTDEFGVPLYVVKDTGLSIDLVFDDPKIGDITVEYVPEPPYVHNDLDTDDLRGLDDRDNW